MRALLKSRILKSIVLLMSLTLSGCGVAEIAALAVIVKIVAGATLAVLVVAGVAWQVESARLDVEKKRLEIEGIRDGKRVSKTISLTDEQVAAIQKTGKLEVQFEDGKTSTINVGRN